MQKKETRKIASELKLNVAINQIVKIYALSQTGDYASAIIRKFRPESFQKG